MYSCSIRLNLRDKIHKIIQELDNLKETKTTKNEKSSSPQTQYEIESSQNNELQKQLEEVSRQKSELEAQLKSQNESIYVMQVIFKQQYDELHELKQRLDEESVKRKNKIINIIRKIDDASF